jgi:hypothetical protein
LWIHEEQELQDSAMIKRMLGGDPFIPPTHLVGNYRGD